MYDRELYFKFIANPGDEVQISLTFKKNVPPTAGGNNFIDAPELVECVDIEVSDSPPLHQRKAGTPADKFTVTVGDDRDGVYVYLKLYQNKLQNKLPPRSDGSDFPPSWAQYRVEMRKLSTTTTTTSTTTTTTTISTTTKAATTKAAKSACGLNEWNLSEGELTGTSVTLDTPGGGGGASGAVTVTTAHQFAKCTVHGDFDLSLYEVDTANGMCSTTAVATGLWTTKKVFEDSPGVNAATTTARVTIAFSTTALAADLQKPKPQIYRKGSTAGKEILSFCVRSMIKVDGHVLKFSEMIVTTTINTVLAIPAIENTDVTRPKANVVTTETLLPTTVHAYECYKDGNTFKGYEGAPKPALTTQENILTVCVTGVAPALECKEFWDLTLKQGSKADDVRVADGENKKSLVTSVFGVQAIENTKLGTNNHGCVAQLLLDSSYFDSAKPEKVTLSGSVRVGLAARRRLLRDERSLSDDHNTKTTKFGVDVDRLQGSTSVVSGGGVATTALATTVLSILAASVSM